MSTNDQPGVITVPPEGMTLPAQHRPATTLRVPMQIGIENRLVGYMKISTDGWVECVPRGDYVGPWVLDLGRIPT